MPLGQAHPRDKLAALLWGDMRQAQARASLRQALTAIRRALAGVGALRVDAETVALDPAVVAVDELIFQQSAKAGTIEALEHAAALYQGDLLAGLALNEAPFEEWLRPHSRGGPRGSSRPPSARPAPSDRREPGGAARGSARR